MSSLWSFISQKTKLQLDKENLEAYIKELFKEDFVNPRIVKQLKQFTKEYGYSYSGIHHTLVYFFGIKQNSILKARGGIGIVPYVYSDARAYYEKLHMVKKQEHSMSEAKDATAILITKPSHDRLLLKVVDMSKYE